MLFYIYHIFIGMYFLLVGLGIFEIKAWKTKLNEKQIRHRKIVLIICGIIMLLCMLLKITMQRFC